MHERGSRDEGVGQFAAVLLPQPDGGSHDVGVKLNDGRGVYVQFERQ